jgi:hypothetical protein
MEEDPKQHDFDQRHDGPFERPSVDVQAAKAKAKDKDAATAPASPVEPRATTFKSPSLPLGRKSMQHERRKNPPISRRSLQQPRHVSDPVMGQLPRARTDMSGVGVGRPSRDFDTRRDGPFGRPSITMTRRKSSAPIPPGPEDRRPSIPGLQAALDEKDREQAAAAGGQEPVAPTVEQLESEGYEFQAEPPPLNYSLWPRKWSILIFWSLIIIDCIAMPVGLYFGLWYGVPRDKLSANAVFSIVTAALGGVSIIEYCLRLRRLMRKGSTCRPIGARRWYLDWFHWNFSVGWVIVVVELIM